MDIVNPSPLTVFNMTTLGYTLGALIHKRYLKPFCSKLKGHERVLELGSGSGAGSRFVANKLLRRNGRLTCVDISETWMDQIRKRLVGYPSVDYIHGDITTLDLPAESQDAALMSFVLHEIDKDHRRATVNALARVIGSEGYLFICEPTRQDHGIPIDEIRDLTTDAGFNETETLKRKHTYTGIFTKNT